MTTRPLGNSGLSIPTLAFGTNILGWTVDQETSFGLLDHLLGAGLNFLDTADVYSKWVPGHVGGESETIIGEWLGQRGRRADVLVATKVGMEGFGGRGLAPERIASAVDASLERLRTDYIDLYFAHTDDPQTPLEATLDAFDRLVTAGKVRAIGASNYSAERLREALDTSARQSFASYSVLQPHYNLVERSTFEGALQDLCVQRGIAVVPYYALASGFLTGKYRSATDASGRARGGAATLYLNDHGLAVLTAVDKVACETQATPAQVALAWLASQPAVAAP